jgi:maleamate amidohydrolase
MHVEGFGGRGGFGRRPALIVVDMTLGFTDPESPLGSDLDGPAEAIQRVLTAARPAEIPVVFTTVAYRESDKLTAAAFIDKVPALLTLEAGSRWAEVDPRIAPRETEPVLNKLFASGFFGTGLSSLLTAAGADTLIVTGASTSGCVRATVVDALQYGFRPVVPREAVGDRDPDAHEASLYDVNAKYGDVVSVEETLEYLEKVREETGAPRLPERPGGGTTTRTTAPVRAFTRGLARGS